MRPPWCRESRSCCGSTRRRALAGPLPGPHPQGPAGDAFLQAGPGITGIAAEPNGDVVFSMAFSSVFYSNGDPTDIDAVVKGGGIYVLQPGQSTAQQLAPQSGPLAVVPVANYVWTGAGPHDLWSDGRNWLAGSAPTPEADLVFPSGAAQLANQDDLGFAFGSVGIADNYTFTGQPLTANSLDVKQGSTEFDCSATVNTTASIDAGASLSMGAGTIFTVPSSGDLSVAGAGSFSLLGASEADVTGTATVAAGGTWSLAAGSTTDQFAGSSVTVSGAVTNQGAWNLAVGASAGVSSSGQFEISGSGSLDDGGSFTVSAGGKVSDQDSVTVASGGLLDISGTLTEATGASSTTSAACWWSPVPA